MTANVEPEEAEALRDALEESAGPRSAVAERDFSRPVRLSAADLEALERRVSAVLGDVEAAFADALGTKCPLELGGLREASAADLFGEDESAFAALRFVAAGQPAWVVWEPVAAVRAVEKVLGSSMEVRDGRRLSSIECGVLQSLLGSVADAVLRALDVEADGVTVAQTREALGGWLDAGDQADPHRLHVELTVEGPGGASRVDAYVPTGLARAAAAQDLPGELPEHLEEVEVEVSVRLEGCAVLLAQLLSLEEGDVIPLDGRVGDPASFCVQGKPYAAGTLGTHLGNLAIRIDRLNEDSEESE